MIDSMVGPPGLEPETSTVSRLNSPSTCNDPDRKQTTSEISSESQTSPTGGFDAPIRAQDLDREVCNFLGIEPKRVNRCKNSGTRHHTVLGTFWADRYPDEVCKECVFVDIYPAVSTEWEGFGLMVAALAKRKIVWGSHNFQEGQAYVKLAPGVDSGNVSSLPEALALAVLKLASGRK